MERSTGITKIASIVMAVVGGALLLLAVLTRGRFNVALPLLFFILTGVFFVGCFSFVKRWKLASLLIVPAAVFGALGLIFLLNILTGDWTSWAYSWLLPLAAMGVGLLVAGSLHDWGKVVHIAAWCLALGGLTLYCIFGVITGGLVIQIIAPLLLIAAGFSLPWLKLRDLLQGGSPLAEPSAVRVQPALGAAAAVSTEEMPLVEPPSTREIEVLRWIEQGLTNQQIAEKLSVAPSTVKTHINNLYTKLGVQTRVQAVKRARELGLL